MFLFCFLNIYGLLIAIYYFQIFLHILKCEQCLYLMQINFTDFSI